jgi:hypothetical protein
VTFCSGSVEQTGELPCCDNADVKALVHRNDSDEYDLRVSYGVANEVGVVQAPEGENSFNIFPAVVVNAEGKDGGVTRCIGACGTRKLIPWEEAGVVNT